LLFQRFVAGLLAMDHSLDYKWSYREARMASAASSIAGVLGILCSGCADWPLNDQDGGQRENSAPFILKERVVPSPEAETDGTVRLSASNLPLTFLVPAVLDSNSQDVLYARWFVGYRADVPALRVVRQEETVGPNGATRSLSPFELSAAMIAAIDAARSSSGLVMSNAYEVRVKITDRSVTDPTSWSPQPGGAEDEWRWVVEVSR
jgi:hypothetical protein